jgi:ATP-binding cassette subfamily B protein
MIAEYYGVNYSLEYFRELCYLSKEGVSLLSINNAAESIGFRTYMATLSSEYLIEDCPLPCVLHWNQDHFVVLYSIKRKGVFPKKKASLEFTVADPAHGIVTLDESTFYGSWLSTSDDKGIVLLLEPRHALQSQIKKKESNDFIFLFQYLRPYKKYIIQLIIGMIATSLISLSFPFLTQLLIDNGVADKNLHLVYVILFSQLFLFIGSAAIGIIRSWLLLHISTRISLNIISDFLIKLLRLPIKFFDSKAVGDLSQRITDHHRIDNFLTTSFLSTIFSIINILVFTIVIAFYDLKILFTFLVLSLLGISWVLLFQNRRKNLDYKRFARNRENQDKLFEMIHGMQEVKLYGAETTMRWKWERLQVKYFKLNIESLALEQYQETGYSFFNHLKNILISFLAVYEVINGRITLGVLLSISFIIGQTNGPIEQLISFIKSAQDAKLSMERLQEIHNKKDENEGKTCRMPQKFNNADIVIKNLFFQYEGPDSRWILKNINFIIPKGKITAIVGSSGSGKTTLMKLLLNYYQPVKGTINIGDVDVAKLIPNDWRNKCGTVMQEGYIFFDTIARNIALDGNEINEFRMNQSIQVANLHEFIDSLPLKYTTKIGASGIGISGGQRQKILIARAIYKNPEYIFFDEATSSLDANNEKILIENLNEFFINKTVVIIAHRLSTVKNAHNIVVLENGEIIESGNHKDLIKSKGKYFELVKNQLELGD